MTQEEKIMSQYIDKSALLAEIKKLINSNKQLKTLDPTYCDGLDDSLNDILSFINTLEVKDVDLEKEIEKVKKMYSCLELKEETIIDFCAKHFFELGLKAQKEE